MGRAERARMLYEVFTKGECHLTDATTAELAKLSENAFRDVNIAFANELSMVCDHLGIDASDVFALANRHPRVNILQPGPGVGGHCIAVDPWFIVDTAPQHARLIRLAREVNDARPDYVIEEVVRTASRFRDPLIACLGLSFKANIDDLRESPALHITAQLAERQVGRYAGRRAAHHRVALTVWYGQGRTRRRRHRRARRGRRRAARRPRRLPGIKRVCCAARPFRHPRVLALTRSRTRPGVRTAPAIQWPIARTTRSAARPSPNGLIALAIEA